MPTLLLMPEVAADTPEATLLSWPIAENVPYLQSDPIVTVETAKAVVDVEAESDGIIFKTLIAEGSDVKVGEAIAVIGVPGETVDDINAVLIELGVGPTGAEDGLVEPGNEDGPAVEPGISSTPALTQVNPPAPTIGAVPNERVFASPLARRLARDAGISINDVAATGPNQRVVRRDIEAVIASRPVSPVPDRQMEPTPAATSATTVDPSPLPRTQIDQLQPVGGYVDIPHSRLRRAIAERLSASKQTTPHFYLSASVNAKRLLKLRTRINLGSPIRVSVNDMIVKAVALAHQRVPEMNVIWSADSVRSFTTVDIAVAVATEKGLVTPVLRNTGATTISHIAMTSKDYVDRARTGKLRQSEIDGGSITITNLGMFGTSDFTAIINPPHSAILAVGAAEPAAIVIDGKVAAGTIIRLTASVDHRAIDGATAARWIAELKAILEAPLQILL